MRATFWKDIRLIVRDPLLLLRILPSAVYVLPVFFTTMSAGGDLSLRLAPLGLLIATQFSMQLTLVAASGEECWDLIRMSPASALRVRWAKLFAGLFGPLLITAALALFLAVQGHLWLATLTLLLSTACACGCSWLEIATIQPTPRADLLRRHSARKPFLRTFSQVLILCLGGATLGLLAFGILWLGLFCLGVTVLGVIACFTFVELDDLPQT